MLFNAVCKLGLEDFINMVRKMNQNTEDKTLQFFMKLSKHFENSGFSGRLCWNIVSIKLLLGS